jgi:NTP pyrophosphatase (non-canonical NTP hydrolase)
MTSDEMGLTISELVKEAHSLACEKGWWPNVEDFSVPEKLALIHSEVSEALEAYRNGEPLLHVVNGKPEGMTAELADVVIRVADLCGALGVDLERAIALKHAYNATRPFRHGGKKV